MGDQLALVPAVDSHPRRRMYVPKQNRRRPRTDVAELVSQWEYVCMYGHHIQQSMDQPGKVDNPARGQLNRENEYFPFPVRA